MLIIASMGTPIAHGQEPKDFGYKLMPEKLVSGTEGLLQIYGLQKNIPIPTPIENLIVVSSNQDVLQVLELSTNEDTSITSVRLKALDSGIVKVAIAAPGFASKEFSITVYDIKQGEQKLLVKTIPDKFTVNGPSKGFFSVELGDIDGNPTLAKSDTTISIKSSNSNIVSLFQDELVIKEGQYFVVGEFQVNKPGEASIYAESQNTDSGSSKISVLGITNEDSDDDEKYRLQLYVMPKKISNFATSSTFAIVQLQSSDGTPIKATEDIPVSLKIDHEDPVFNDKRSSEISTIDSLVIPSGSTTGYAKLSVKAGIEDTYEAIISAEDYTVSDPVTFQTVLTPDVIDPLTKIDTIPLLASGSEQLIGVLYPSDENGVALINLQTVESEINSSDRQSLVISDDRMEKGSGAKLIYGKLGVVKPSTLEITVLAEKKETVLPIVFGPEKSDLKLVVEPLIPKVMPKTDFPMIAYMKNSESSWYFPETSNVVMIPNEFVKSSVQTVSEGQSSVLLNSHSLKEGKGVLEFEVSEFSTKVDLATGISKPAKINLTYPDHLLSGMKNTLSLQILDSVGNPIFTNKDVQFRMTANDNSIEIPEIVTITKGSYNVFFDIIPKQNQVTEISVLADDFPLSKFNLNTVETNPSLIISTVNSIESGKSFDLVLDAKVLDVPLSDIKIKWDIQGAEVKQISEVTDNNGKIKVTLVANDADKISILASTSEFSQVTASKEIKITRPGEVLLPTSENNLENHIAAKDSNIIENNLGFILIPGLVVGSTILIRKRSLLDPLAERFPIIEQALDRFNEIFDKLEITERFETIKEKIPIIKNR